jgi:hypothetical protein
MPEVASAKSPLDAAEPNLASSGRHSQASKRLAIWLLSVAAFALILAAISRRENLKNLVLDPSTLGGIPAWHGSLSMVGLLLWSAGSTACLLAAALVRRTDEGGTEPARFLLVTGVLAALAAIDDALLIHEAIAPDELGVPQNVVLIGWVVAIVAWAFRFRGFLIRSDLLLLGLAAGAFTASMGLDIFDANDSLIVHEDYYKLIGVATFASYCWLEAAAQLTRRLGPRRPAEASPWPSRKC